MNRWPVVVVLVVCLAPQASPAQSPAPLPKPTSLAGYVEIDGKKHPEQIPDYVAWGEAFRSLALLQTQGFADVIANDVGSAAAGGDRHPGTGAVLRPGDRVQ